jgi:hypothetical protein
MNDNFPTLDQLRLPDQQTFRHVQAIPKEQKISSKPPKIQGEFLKGPIPLAWLGRAAKLPGKASLATALAVMFGTGQRGEVQLLTPQRMPHALRHLPRLSRMPLGSS